MSTVKPNTIKVGGYKLTAVKIENSGACRVAVKVNGFSIDSNILLSALPSAMELETLLVRFDVDFELDACRDVVEMLKMMYAGPRHVLSVSDNITYQGRTSAGALRKFEEDFDVLRIDNFLYLYNPWYTAPDLA